LKAPGSQAIVNQELRFLTPSAETEKSHRKGKKNWGGRNRALPTLLRSRVEALKMRDISSAIFEGMRGKLDTRGLTRLERPGLFRRRGGRGAVISLQSALQTDGKECQPRARHGKWGPFHLQTASKKKSNGPTGKEVKKETSTICLT